MRPNPLLSQSLKPVKYQKIMSSVYAIAYGLHKYLKCTENKCSRRASVINYPELYKEIINVKFVLPNSTTHIRFKSNSEYFHLKYDYTMADLRNVSGEKGNAVSYISIGSRSNWTISINTFKINWIHKTGTNFLIPILHD